VIFITAYKRQRSLRIKGAACFCLKGRICMQLLVLSILLPSLNPNRVPNPVRVFSPSTLSVNPPPPLSFIFYLLSFILYPLSLLPASLLFYSKKEFLGDSIRYFNFNK
jgi:hypothetical protein